MRDVLRRALEPVLRDIAASGAPAPDVRDDDWADDAESASAMLWSIEGNASGVRVDLDATEVGQVCMVADQVQDWMIDELWGRRLPTNWPPCPRHPNNHPLAATTRDSAAVWVCPQDGLPVSSVGSVR